MITIAAPCVAAHLLVTPQPCPREGECLFQGGCDCKMYGWKQPMVLRFLPTDADTVCETCLGCSGDWTDAEGETIWLDCPGCDGKQRRPLRAGDRIAIRAGRKTYRDAAVFGGYLYRRRGWGDLDYPHGPHYIRPFRDGQLTGPPIVIRPGEVVGRATVARVLPIIGGYSKNEDWDQPLILSDDLGVTEYEALLRERRNLSDHLDAGLTFTPGQVALELTEVEPT